jgi:predicted TIM-barrel fold metal-dependent hydrolase
MTAMLPSPVHWRKVCEEFPKLRVNLGHIGAVWAFAPTDPQGQAQTTLAKSWATEIATLMHDFENVYADIAFFDLALVDTIIPDSPTALALEFIAELGQHYAVPSKRLMYGSDWIMVGQLTAGNDYARRVEQSRCHRFSGMTPRWKTSAGVMRPAIWALAWATGHELGLPPF